MCEFNAVKGFQVYTNGTSKEPGVRFRKSKNILVNGYLYGTKIGTVM